MKKVLSLVLVIAMVLSSFSLAFAAPKFEDIADTDYEEAVNTLVALGVITGYEDGTYKPERVVTRAEMAKLMVELLGYGDLVAGSKSNFSDTQGHWADAWIALAAGRGIVIGDGDGNFRPNATVTYDEVYTMLVRGLGYTDDCNELKGMTWPTNFKVKAAELGITKGVAMDSTGADRGGVAQAMANALEASLVAVTVDGDVTILQDTYQGTKYDRLLLTRLATLKYSYKVSEETLDPDNRNYGGDVIDLAPYMFQDLEVYLNDDDEVVYINDVNSLVVEGKVDDVDGLVVTIEEANGKTKDINFKDADKDDILNNDQDEIIASKVFENGAIKESNIEMVDDDLDLGNVEYIKVVANDTDEDGKIDADEIEGIVITLRTDVVRIEKEYVEGKDSINGIDLPVDSDDEVDLDAITVTGDADSLEDIKKDDIVVAYETEDNSVITLVVVRDTVEGKITRVDSSTKYYINGVKYETGYLAIESDFDLGDEGVFYLDQFGEIVDYDGESVGPTDYAVVIGSADGDVASRFGYSVDTYPELKLATQDGEEIIYEVEVDVDYDDVAGKLIIDDTAEYEDGDLFDDADLELDEEGVYQIKLTNTFTNVDNYLIKYSLNKDGRIDEIKLVEKLKDSSYDVIDLDKDSNTLLSNAIIFDAGDKFDVVDASVLPTKVSSFVVRNKAGEIEVLVAKAGQIDEAADVVFAYIYNVDNAYNDDGDAVQYVDAYTDNEDKGIYTNKKGIFSGEEKVYAFKYDGNAIKEIKTFGAYDGTTDPVTYGQLGGLNNVVTASAVNAKGNMIKIDNKWYGMSEHGTVVFTEKNSEGVYEEDGLADLYDIDKGVTEFEAFVNSDGDIDLIVIRKN